MSKDAAEVLAKCHNLPTIPAIALEILRLSRDEDVNLREIADVISRDVALSGRILSVVNSAYYGLSGKVATISQAVVMLGLGSVKTLALGFSLAESISAKGIEVGDLQAFWLRSLHLAVAARTFADRKMPAVREEAFTVGLLADVGTLAMCEAFGRQYDDLCITTGKTHADIIQQEQSRFDLDHQQTGQAMAESWHLPKLLAVPIAHHHDPQNVSHADPVVADLTSMLYAANLCAEMFCGDVSADMVEQFESAVQEYLDLDSHGCRVLIETLHRDTHEVAKILEIQIPDSMSYAEIVQQANQVLTRLSLQTQQKVQEVERTQKEASSRVEALEKSNLLLAQKANTDPLTGIYNRRFMEGFIEREIARAVRFRRPLSVLFIDVDYFKDVNDRYGHLTGDVILQQLARLLGAAARDVDCLCRYGGEEFVITLLETDLWGACHLAEKIRRLVAAWKFKGQEKDTKCHITVSIGVSAMNPDRPINEELLIQMADESAYAAKRDGRNCVCALRKRISPVPEEQLAEESHATAE